MEAENVYYATGRRKNAIARTWLKPGTGEIMINDRPLENYFSVESAKTLMLQPFELTNTSGTFDVRIKVIGGGIVGQAGGIRHGINRALLLADPDLRTTPKNLLFRTTSAFQVRSTQNGSLQPASCFGPKMKNAFRILLVIVAFIVTQAPSLPARARTVTDQLGRQVTIPDAPVRIVSLAPSITEIVFALGREDCLKGVTQFSDYPAGAMAIPRVGSYVHLDLEKIVALKPDLCIAVKDGNPLEIVRRLDLIGIPVYAVDPRDLDTVTETVLEIGGLLNTPARAEQLARNMTARVGRVKRLVAQTAVRPGVFFQIGISPIVSVGANTFNHELIRLAGGRNLVMGPAAYPRFSKEQVLALAPDVIIICSMARQGGFEQMKAEWNHWTGLPAVRNQRIFLVDSNLFNRPTPRLVDGLELLFELIHPELAEAQ